MVTQKLQSLSEGAPSSGDMGSQLSDCQEDAASLRFAWTACFAPHMACSLCLLKRQGLPMYHQACVVSCFVLQEAVLYTSPDLRL